jgi:nicotinate phosphoribosyltransferase
MREVRWELDRNGFGHVKIFASGGIDVEYILHLNPVCDAYGVGGAIADAPMIDYSLDIVEVNGETAPSAANAAAASASSR